jgi:hypothetical protein
MRDRHDFLVVIGSRGDSALNDALKLLESFSDDSLHEFAFIDAESLAKPTDDPIASIYAVESYDPKVMQAPIFSWVASNRPSLKTIRLVAASTEMQASDAHREIVRGVNRLAAAVNQYAVHVDCPQYHLAFPSVNDGPPSIQLMTSSSRLNLIVIPRDSTSFDAVARPMSRDQSGVFVSHIASELATIFGLWREMPEAGAIDDVPRIPPGDNEIIVYFVSSRVGILHCPPLPIAQLMSGQGELPCPNDFYPLPDPASRVQAVADGLYPEQLRFANAARPDFLTYVKMSNFWRRYIREFSTVVSGLPRLLLRGIQSELNEIGRTAFDEVLGGSESVIRLVGTDIDGDARPVSKEYVESVINEWAKRDTQPILSVIGSSTWTDLVDQFLGVADGAKVSETIRRNIADEHFLCVGQDALAPQVLDLNAALEEIFAGSRNPESFGGGADEKAKSTVGEIVLEGSPALLDDATSVDLESFVLTNVSDEIMAPLHSDEPDATLLSPEPLPPPSAEEPAPVLDSTPADVRVRRSVLAVIGGLLEENASVARNQAAEMVNMLSLMPEKFKANVATSYSRAVRLAIAIGFSVLYFVTGALTERRYLLSGEPLGVSGRDYVWTLFSTIMILASLIGLLLKNSDNSQGRVIGFTTFSLVVIAAEYVFFARVRDFVLTLDIVRESAIVGVAILALTTALVGVSYTRNRLSAIKMRRKYASLLITLAWLYGLLGVTAYLGTDWSPLRNLSTGTSLRLMIVGYVLGCALILSAALVTALVIMRERYRIDRAREELTWAVDELARASEASRRLMLARSQWLGTAIPLARLIRYPLGASIALSEGTELAPRPRFEVLKIRENLLNLNRKGEQSLSARVRTLFVRSGWLSRQYQQMIVRYREDRARTLGVRVEEVGNDRPEGCPATPTFDEILSGGARGARWDYLRSVTSGEYDDALLSVAGEVPLEEAYETIIEDEEAHVVGDSKEIAPEFFACLLPVARVPLPGGLVNTLFVGGDERQELDASVWWPDELVPRPNPSPNGVSLRSADVLTPDRLTSWIRLLGACVLTSKPFRLSEVTIRGVSIDDSESVSTEKFLTAGRDL